ncbi:uncharacterized protein LOC136073917 [Hydra vulgaris]|uniref:uncharacterized protein LOC136073917 n=1 Tax=Hydra vulgaris TaxID=6087 RepID=UPI0032EA1BFA
MQSGIIKTDITDHFPVFLITDSAIPKKKIETKTIYVRNINNESIVTFRDLLQEINWELLNDCNDVNNGYDFFIRVFTKQYEKAFPKLKKQSKKNYYSLLLNKTFGNARKTWNVIKEITGVRNVKIDNFPKRLQRDGNIGDAFVNKEIAETINDFFINIGKKLAGAIPERSKLFESFLKKSDSIMDESELLVDELRLAISMLKTNKSAGLDEINPDVVKAVSDIIEKPLFIIFNLSLRNGIFPDQLKLAKIIPIYKIGDDSIKSNYRPISILSCGRIYPDVIISEEACSKVVYPTIRELLFIISYFPVSTASAERLFSFLRI